LKGTHFRSKIFYVVERVRALAPLEISWRAPQVKNHCIKTLLHHKISDIDVSHVLENCSSV